MRRVLMMSMVVCSVGVCANTMMPSMPERKGPPSEALEACQGREEQASCKFSTPRGQLLVGVCRVVLTGQKACVPNTHPLREKGIHQGAGTGQFEPNLGQLPPQDSTKPLRPPYSGNVPSSTNAHASQSFLKPKVTITSSTPRTAKGTFTIPDTNQKRCYDSFGTRTECMFSGQDGMYVKNPPSFKDNHDGTVTDKVTGIMWQQSPDTNEDGTINTQDKMSAREAIDYCETLTLAGYSDWGLPDIKSLYSLIDFSGRDVSGSRTDKIDRLRPFINTSVFDFNYGDMGSGERIIDMQYASSTLYSARHDMLFGVNFADGRIKGYGLFHPQKGEKTFAVQCARNIGSYGQNNFKDNQNGTVSDLASGLMWQKNDSQAPMEWAEAIDYCESLKLGEYDDWKLPDAKELQSIVDYSRSPDTTNSAAISDSFTITSFINEDGYKDFGYFWTSTTHDNERGVGSNAVYISFGRALGYMRGGWRDVHGAGAQRSDPKTKQNIAKDRQAKRVGTAYSKGPQGDLLRGENFARCVRVE